MSALPSHAYYAPLQGRWECAFDFAITDEAAFSASLGWLDRQRLRGTVWLPKLLGPLAMKTSVDYRTRGAEGVVAHTTRVSKWGVTLLSSEETLTLDENGRDFTMRGAYRMSPTPWRAHDFGDGRGTVDASGTRASYTFTWMGTTMTQTTVAAADTVTITQETVWSRGVQVLRRIAG